MPTDQATQVRFFRFLVVGGTSALAQLGLLWLMRRWSSDDLAFTVSYAGSTALHYALNRWWALPSGRHDSGRQLGEYLGTVALSYAITYGAYKALHDGIGLGALWATAGAIPPATAVVFLLLNYRVFRQAR
jgi:putative flippase GtrA